ncbi:hypothetical protein PIB30_104954 [Stylosanthes scabra]|uniref:Uncharacterized protein n=1 Tax=Stylosanthes scabra TaxID=79078 RepID=A0ABU6TXY7_9FABA|nr:hypothetical protein [Stylosanthes scabra]
MSDNGGAKELVPDSALPVQPSNSNSKHSNFEFGNNGNSDNKEGNNMRIDECEENPLDTMHGDSVKSHAQDEEWIEVQRKRKKKLGPALKKPTSGKSHPRLSHAGPVGRVGKPKPVSSSGVGKPTPSPSSLISRDAAKVGKPSSGPPISTPAPLHPYKRRRPPSLQNSPTEKDLEIDDGALKTGTLAQPLAVQSAAGNGTARHGGSPGPAPVASGSSRFLAEQGNASLPLVEVAGVHSLEQGKGSAPH